MELFRPVSIGTLKLDGNLFLAPVAGYTDRSFRSLCAEQGACFSFTELVSAEALCRNFGRYGIYPEDFTRSRGVPSECPDAENKKKREIHSSAVSLIRRGEKEKRYAIQLFAGESESIYKAVCLLSSMRPDAIDINAGCPVQKVVKNGAGSALMKNPSKLGKVVEEAVRASDECLGGIPVTIKIRSGWDSKSLNYDECARIAVEAGASMISLHPRTRTQGYGGKSDWSYIANLVTRLPVPVTGSGDLYSPEDAQHMLTETGCAAVMFARGAIGNPFIFSQTRSLLQTGSCEEASFSARIETALRHLEMLSADIGERTACLEMRKQFCAYTKGMKGGAALREKAVHAGTIEEYRKITFEYQELI
ncbi:MAG: tRNA-dihydrouridine synthase [Treponema sp.]|nr:tRNA-dihydrouridine synthase [Treponema sp.]